MKPPKHFSGGNYQDKLPLMRAESMPEPRGPYQPKNSNLIEEKTVQRNGKTVLIRKYSVNENGKINKYTHETVIR